jgi:hypothetical protein
MKSSLKISYLLIITVLRKSCLSYFYARSLAQNAW